MTSSANADAAQRSARDTRIDATIQESFPASDPPSWWAGLDRPLPRGGRTVPSEPKTDEL